MAVEITNLCETFHCLPSDLFEQDPDWIDKMKLVLDARNEFETEKNRRQQQKGRR